MNYRVEIRPDALSDIENAAAWYEGREAGLGKKFVRSIRQGVTKLSTKSSPTESEAVVEIFDGVVFIVSLSESFTKFRTTSLRWSP